ncbi:MAG: hypothetical protein J0H41_18660 [Rhizobiales bacterium]|nr:hypothetical protein [Hyphomicrobiales bacterium]
MTPPTVSQARMLFSLRRNGTLMGDPRVLVTNVDAAPALTDAFARSLVSAVKACAPFPMDYKLAGAVAGRLLTFRMSFKPNGKAGVDI